MLSIDPKELAVPQLHSYLLSAVGPRPIAFASTVDKEGKPNLSPFSFFNVFSSNPPILIFSPARRARDNSTKHTLQNVYEIKEVVINVVDYAIVQQMNLASAEYAKGVNEFTKSGLTPIASEIVKPSRVKESPVQFECKVKEVVELGQDGGAGNLIISEILKMHISESILDKEGKIDANKIDLVGRMGGALYCRASGNALFSIHKPSRNLGIGVDAIPEKIRLSTVLTGNDLGILGSIPALPTAVEIDSIKEQPEIQEILKRYQNDEESLEYHLHKYAQELIQEGRVTDAWKSLLVESLTIK